MDRDEVLATVRFEAIGTPRGAPRAGIDRALLRARFVPPAEDGGAAGPPLRIASLELLDGDRQLAERSLFAEVGGPAGIAFENRYYPPFLTEPLPFGMIRYGPAGITAADYDNDGLHDLFIPDGVASRLYRNLGDGTFQDVTEAAGLLDQEGGLSGVSVALLADFDGDGRKDLFVSRTFEPNQLFRADGVTFTDVTARSGLAPDCCTTVASAADYDLDGDLDLYVGRYLDPRERIPTTFYARNGEPNRLYRNDGDLRFTDVTAEAGVGDTGLCLGSAFADYDDDGWPDLWVANDFGRKTLYRNRGAGPDGVTFEDVTVQTGTLAYGAGMSSTVGDYDNDGRLDLYVAHIRSEHTWYAEAPTVRRYMVNSFRQGVWTTDMPLYLQIFRQSGPRFIEVFQQMASGNTLLRNRGPGEDGVTFEDATRQARANPPGWFWGTSFADFDNDGWLDLYAADGWVYGEPGTEIELDFLNDVVSRQDVYKTGMLFDPEHFAGRSWHGWERNRHLRNDGPDRDGAPDGAVTFTEIGRAAGTDLLRNSRGIAVADFWNRGVLDIAVAASTDRHALLANLAGGGVAARGWLEVEVTGAGDRLPEGSNPDGVGARITLEAGGLTQTREVILGDGYGSQNSLRQHFGPGRGAAHRPAHRALAALRAGPDVPGRGAEPDRASHRGAGRARGGPLPVGRAAGPRPGRGGRRVTAAPLALVLAVLGAGDAPHEPAWFLDVTEAAGVARPHRNRSFDNPYAHVMEGYTALGAAVAVADFDGDGFDDLFVTDSSEDGRNLLYRNRGDFTFTEVGEAAGVARGNDAGNASADALWLDYDGDGREDLLVVRFGRSQLFRNDGPDPGGGGAGGVTFREVTRETGLDRYLNSITAVAFDYDGDGDLDLLLGNYFAPVDLFDPDTPLFFPESFETAANGGGLTLYRNQGPDSDGPTFIDATAEAGLAHHTGWTLDVGHADADHDGDEDLYVAADFGTDRFFLNNGDGTFTDATGTALGGFDTKKGMNAEWGDFDNDGLFDVYVTNITDEYMREGNFFWKNQGPAQEGTGGGPAGVVFADVSAETGTRDTGWGWAGKLFDYDNDGWLDLYVVNGWVSAGPENYVVDVFELIMASAEDDALDLADARNWPPMGEKTLSGYQRNHLFHNRDGTLFEDRAARHGVDSVRDARGVAVADLDHDGRLDLFVTNAGAEPHLYRNVQPTGNRWLELVLEGSGRNPAAVGARVWATAGGTTRVRFVDGGNGFAGQSTRRIHFGLGDAGAVERLEIAWPSGRRQVFEAVAADRIYCAVEGNPELQPFPPGRGEAAPPRSGWHPDGAGETEAVSEDSDPGAGRTQELFASGLAAAEAGDLAAALDRLETAAAARPDHLRYGAEYRQAAIAAEEYDRAIAFFEKLAGRHPDSAAVRLNWGYAYVDRIPAAGSVTAVILADRALKRFTEALEREETWLGLYTRGNSYVYWPPIFNRTRLAIADLERAIELEKEGEPKRYHAHAWSALGDAWWRLDDLEKAREVWREGLERHPETPYLEERLAREGEALDEYLNAHYALGNRVETDLREIWEADR
jgi:tetratricopeptide (TPR) repeat protein